MVSSVEKIIKGIATYNKSPASIQQVCINALEEVISGDDIVDPTSPFIFLLEAGAAASAAAIAESESVTRKLYPVLATRQSDLYRHMSDKDYVGRFATPAGATIKLLMPLSQLLLYAVTGNASNIRSVRIPRNSYFEVNGYRLGIHYPIRIDVLNDNLNGIQVVYETDIISPLKTLKSNVLATRQIRLGSSEYLEISIPVEQFSIDSTTYPLEGTSGFQRSIPFSDQFLYARAYVQKMVGVDKVWEEILTTHSLEVYDINIATLVLEVHEGRLFVTLPDIYQNNGLAGTALRIDIFTTQGPLNTDLSEVPNANFSWTWEDLDTFADNTLVAPLNKITDNILFSESFLTGGSDGLSLEEMRERVIYGVGNLKAPITAGDVEIGLKILDYNVVRYIDNVTDRLFVASKHLPYRVRNGLSTTVRASNTMVIFNELVTGYDRSLINHVSSNRATVLPDAIYDITNNGVSLLTDAALTALEGLAPLSLVATLNSNNYFYSPFHYVMDYSSGIFKVRPYLLSTPNVVGRTFESNNTELDYNLTTQSITVELVDDRYVITVIANDPSKIVFNGGVLLSQLNYKGVNGTYGYLNATATLVTNTTVSFVFELETTFDVDEDNQIEITNFFRASGAVFPMFIDLEAEFDLFYFHENGIGVGSISGDYDDTQFTNPITGATYETLTLELGRYLGNLYTPNRSLIGEVVYQTYPADVPAVYTETVYASGPYGTAFTVNPDDSVSLTVLHNIGDPVLDGSNNPIMAHLAGDYVRDGAGNLIVVDPGNVQRHVGITMVDAIYRFGTTDEVIAYNKQIPLEILGYLDNEVAPAAELLAERTRLEYKPRDGSGNVRVYLGGGVSEIISSILDFKVTYYLTNIGLADLDLRSSLTTMTRNEISQAVRQTTLSASNLESILESKAGSEVLSVEIERFGENKSIPIMTLAETDKSFSVRELITQLPDGSLDVRDAIDVVFTSAL